MSNVSVGSRLNGIALGRWRRSARRFVWRGRRRSSERSPRELEREARAPQAERKHTVLYLALLLSVKQNSVRSATDQPAIPHEASDQCQSASLGEKPSSTP